MSSSGAASEVPSSAPSAPAVPPPAAGDIDDPVAAVAEAWGSAYCSWDYRQPYGAREAVAKSLMTPAGAAALIATPAAAWQRQVVAAHQVATCGPVSVHVTEGGRSAGSAYVLIGAGRMVSDDAGISSTPFLEPRQVVEVAGRWLVDTRVEGG